MTSTQEPQRPPQRRRRRQPSAQPRRQQVESPHVLIIGGGLAGLSAGCYARKSGLRTTIVEHNLALGGVCTAWHRNGYVIDGCIHWLTGGPFARVYEELGITPAVALRTLERWLTYRDVRTGVAVSITRDLDALVRDLRAIAPEDGRELERLRASIDAVVEVKPPLAAVELGGVREQVRALWEMRDAAGPVAHFRKPMGAYVNGHIKSAQLRSLLLRCMPETAPALMLLWVLGYLERGWLSRPVGGTAAFRAALEQSYRDLGGDVLLPATVDEIVVDGGRARAVRLADGTLLDCDAVISTSSAPETVLRLLGGRYDAEPTRKRLEQWPLFDPIALVSLGVAQPYREMPPLLLLDGVERFDAGGRENDHLYVRVCNDDASFAPPGHSVVQTLLSTDYAWWATRGAHYHDAKSDVIEAALCQLEPYFQGVRASVRMADAATPLTYWKMARSWRGAYEGWLPRGQSVFGRVPKTLRGLERFYMAGQWVEPGGGVPTAVLSGRQAVELLCAELEREFRPEQRPPPPPQ